MSCSLSRYLKLLVLVAFVVVSSRDLADRRKPAASRAIRSYLADDDTSEKRDEKSGMWFGPRLGRSAPSNQDHDIVTWIYLDDFPRPRPSNTEGIELSNIGKIFGEWRPKPELHFPVKISRVYPSSYSKRTPKVYNTNPSAAMWFGPRVGRSYHRNTLMDEVANDTLDSDSIDLRHSRETNNYKEEGPTENY